MFCGKCGKENVDGVKFCIHCGYDLSRLTPPHFRGGPDTLDRQVTIADAGGQPQYDTLDMAATTGGRATILGGQYRIVKKLGEGGMGVVYLAEDMEMGDRPVAIKVLPPNLADNVRAVENLRKEAITAINLNHPNIIRLYGFHSDGDIKFLVMEYIDGTTLEQKLAKAPQGTLTLDETVAIAEKIALALDYAHSRKAPVFHRDLKPSNVMISSDGEVKLLDFGIAREMKDSYTRITGKQDTAGTLPYMSPEQVRGKKPSAAMDIYALGVVCYECLSGHPPFHTGELTYQILHEEPEELEDVPPYINEAIQRALAKDPAERPLSARSLIELLNAETVPQYDQVKPVAPHKEAKELPMAVAPFDAAKAKEYQKQTAQALGVSVDKTVDLGDGVKMDFVLIPAGEFDMGSPDSEEDRGDDEGPVHRVKMSKPFYMGKFPVTQEQYLAIIGKNPSHFSGKNLPVEEVSWDDSVEFCEKLSRKDGKTYRLPTEGEWEYACRAGTRTPFHTGATISTDQANYDGNYTYGSGRKGVYRQKTTEVSSFSPSAFGLYDMHGNMWEWCSDRYGENYYSSSPGVDPQGPDTGSCRVLRGGSWDHVPCGCRSAFRLWGAPDRRVLNIGFRIVLLPD